MNYNYINNESIPHFADPQFAATADLMHMYVHRDSDRLPVPPKIPEIWSLLYPLIGRSVPVVCSFLLGFLLAFTPLVVWNFLRLISQPYNIRPLPSYYPLYTGATFVLYSVPGYTQCVVVSCILTQLYISAFGRYSDQVIRLCSHLLKRIRDLFISPRFVPSPRRAGVNYYDLFNDSFLVTRRYVFVRLRRVRRIVRRPLLAPYDLLRRGVHNHANAHVDIGNLVPTGATGFESFVTGSPPGLNFGDHWSSLFLGLSPEATNIMKRLGLTIFASWGSPGEMTGSSLMRYRLRQLSSWYAFFLSLHPDKNEIQIFEKYLVNLCYSGYIRPTGSEPDVPPPSNFIAFLDWLDSHLDGVSSIPSSVHWGHCVRIMTFLGAFGILNDQGFSTAKVLGLIDSWKFKKWEENDGVFQLSIEVVKSLSSLARLAVSGLDKDHDQIVSVVDFIDRVKFLQDNVHCREPSGVSPMPGRVSDDKWISVLHTCWDSASDFRTTYDRSLQVLLRDTHRILEELYITAQKGLGDRQTPFNVALLGEAGTGKTTIISKFIAQDALRALGHEYRDDCSVVLQAGDKYMSPLVPSRHSVVIIDELGSSDPNYTEAPIQPQLLGMLGGGDHAVNSAAIADKGKRFYRPQVNILCSNVDDCGVSDYIRYKPAFYRRMNLAFRIEVKSQYRRDNGQGIDSSKVPEGMFNILRVYPLKPSDNGFTPLSEKHIEVSEMRDMIFREAKLHAARRCLHAGQLSRVMDAKRCLHDLFSCPECGDAMDPLSNIVPTGLYFDKARAVFNVTKCYFQHQMDNFTDLRYGYFTRFGVFLGELCDSFGLISQMIGCQITITVLARVISATRLRQWTAAQHLRASRLLSWCKYPFMPSTYVDVVANARARDDDRKSRFLCYYPFVSILAGAVASLMVYKIYSRFNVPEKTTPSVSSFFEECYPTSRFSTVPQHLQGKPPPASDITGNAYTSRSLPDYDPGSCASIELSILTGKVRRNTFWASISYGGEIYWTHITGIGSQFFIGPYHNLYAMSRPDSIINIYSQCPPPLEEQTLSFIVSDDTYHSQSSRMRLVKTCRGGPGIVREVVPDVGMIRLVDMDSMPSILKYFEREVEYRGVLRSREGCNWFFKGYSFVMDDVNTNFVESVPYETAAGRVVVSGHVTTACKYPSFSGRCGTVLALKFGNQICLSGMNVAGNLKQVNVFASLNQKQLENAMSLFEMVVLTPLPRTVSTESPTLSRLVATSAVFDERNHLFYSDSHKQGGIRAIANLPDIPLVRQKSKVYFTEIKESFEKHFPPEYHSGLGIPMFNGVDVDGVYKSPETNALRDLAIQANLIDPSDLDAVVVHLIDKFSQADFSEDQIIDQISAVAGDCNTPLVNSMPRKTSGGFGWPGKKFSYLEPYPTERAPDGVIPTEELACAVDNYILAALEGRRSDVVFKTCVKDEPRAPEKVKDRKIRIFALGPVDFFVVCKMYLGMFCSLFTANFLQTETCGGVNCFSSQWGEIFTKLKRFPNVVNGDFKAFDKRLPISVLMASFSIIAGVKDKARSLADGELKVLQAIASDISTPILLVGRDLISVAGSHSSGVLTTFMSNNISNSIYIRLAFIYAYRQAHPTRNLSAKRILELFEKHVVYFALGDDNTYSVSDGAVSFFNFGTIQSYFDSIGIVYTPADKSDTSYKSVPVSEATIGKRTFVACEETGFFLCPIEKPSIGKILCVSLRSGPLTDRQRLLQCLDAAMPEFAQYGRASYNTDVDRLRKVLDECNLTYKIPSFDSIHSKQVTGVLKPWEQSRPAAIVEEDIVACSL